MQHAARDQFAVAKPLSVGRNRRAVFSTQSFCRQIEAPRGLGKKKFTRLRGGVLNRGTAVLHGMAAGGVLFVGGQAGVGGKDSQRFESKIPFLTPDLLKKRF